MSMIHFSSNLRNTLRSAGKVPVLKDVTKKLLTSSEAPSNWLDVQMVNNTPVITGIPTNAKGVTSRNYKSHPARSTVRFAAFVRKVTNCSEDQARRLLECITGELAKGQTEVEIKSGEDIRYWYHGARSAYVYGGNLRSCMSHAETQHQLDFYVYNPETIKLATIIEDNLLKARSLILTGYFSEKDALEAKNSVTFQGRIYYSELKYYNMLKTWGEKSGYLRLDGTLVQDIPGGKFVDRQIYVATEHWKLNYYPYMDHMGYMTNSGLWTNRRGSGYTEVGQTFGFHREKEPTLDPFRPGMIWRGGKWQPQEDFVWVPNDGWRKPVKLATCTLCKKKVAENTLRKSINGGVFCTSHLNNPKNPKWHMVICYTGKSYTYTKIADATQCSYCGRNFVLEAGTWCLVCKNNYRTCSGCDKVYAKSSTKKTGKGYLCVGRCLPIGVKYCKSCKHWPTEPCRHQEVPTVKFTKARINI